MITTISTFFSALIFAFISLPQTARGQENSPPKRLSAADKQVLSEALIDAYIRKFNREVKTGGDVEKVLFSKLPAKERADIGEIYGKLGPAPKLSRKGDTLTFKFEKSELRVRWPNLRANQVYIEGMSWAFDPSGPMKLQINNLNDKIKAAARKTEEASFRFSILPEANAAVPLIVAACIASTACTWAVAGVGGAVIGTWGGKIAGNISGVIYDTACYGASEAGMKPWSSIGWCRDWKAADEEWKKKALASVAEAKDPNLEWVAGNPKCPPKDEKGIELFDSYLAEIRKKSNGDWPDEAKWSRFIGKAADGNLTEGFIFETSQRASMDNIDEAKKQLIFTKDKDAVLDYVKFRLPDGSYKKIMTTDAAADIPIEFREEMKKMIGMSEAAKAWAKTCRTLARAAKVSPATADAASKVMQQQERKPADPATSTK